MDDLLSGVVEHDLNPFFLFEKSGKAAFLNQSAELLLGYASVDSFFRLAARYASAECAMHFEPLSFRSFRFYALMAGNESALTNGASDENASVSRASVNGASDESASVNRASANGASDENAPDENASAHGAADADTQRIWLRLYLAPIDSNGETFSLNELEAANIYAILDANIAQFKSHCRCEVEAVYDPTLPAVKLKQNEFSQLVGKSLRGFAPAAISVTLSLVTGEAKVILGRRFPLAKLVIRGEKRSDTFDHTISAIAQSMWIATDFGDQYITLEIPLVG